MAKLSQIHSGEMLRSASGKGFSHIDDNQLWFSDSPLLSKEGQPRSGGVVCSKMRSHLIDGREALLINRYCSTLNRPPQPSLREGIPALLRRGISRVVHALEPRCAFCDHI